ncbi:galectin-3-binding protein A-like [Corythoichthys intestinalis]|uniref:galectin-3-binding protein A-like n=1 Tax=Corythoichthys intestinalis TaxID=161448 RepID=UPI0025A4DF65|nr:galectin-3-binding protein A-like [Corythoichthys intestinalis]
MKMPLRPNILTLWLLLLLEVSGSSFRIFNEQTPDAREGALRLFNGEGPWSGRVEVFHNGRWGTVCDDGWDLAEAQVVCRQLNFPGAKSVVIGKNYGTVSGRIWLDDVKCNGTERSLLACRMSNWGVTDCTHKEDVGVICEAQNATVRNFTHSLDHSISLSDDLGALFDSEQYCDFIMVLSTIESEADDDIPETTICAHRIILSSFLNWNMSEGMTVNVSLACLPYVKSFVRYFYTRKMDVSVSSAQCLHQMASQFQMRQLMEDIGRLFTQILPDDPSFQTQLSLLHYAMQTGDHVLRENCIQYLAWNFHKLTQSPAWHGLSWEVLGALLSRSDLVVPDEYFVLRTVEREIQEKGNKSTWEARVKLLNHVRFPMISVETLYDLELKSPLYSSYKNVYQEKMLKAMQFNVLLFSNLTSHPNFSPDEIYQPRIYTAKPWSVLINATKKLNNAYFNRYDSYNRNYYNPGRYEETPSKRFYTRRHSSMVFKDQKATWEANFFKTRQDCFNVGQTCESAPVAALVLQSSVRPEVTYHNRLVVMCQDKYVSQVQEFKNNMAYIANNGSSVQAYPCPEELYVYFFVVRPEYI